MKLVTTLFFGCVMCDLLVGCATRPSAPPIRDTTSVSALFNPYAPGKIEVMKARMRMLKIGMTLDQCYETLGLDHRQTIADAQEFPSRVLLQLYPAEGHVIGILLDTSQKTPGLLSVRIDDAEWPPLRPESQKPIHAPEPTTTAVTPPAAPESHQR